MLSELLTVAFVGRRWQQPESHDGLAVFDDTCRSVFGISDAAFTDALRAAYWRSRWPEVSDPLALMRGPVTPREHERATVTRLLRRVLEPYAERAKGPWGREVLDDVLLGLRREAVMHGLRGLAADAADHWAGRPASALGDLRRRGAELRGEIRAVRAHRARQWAQWREGLDPPGGRPLHADIEDRVAGFLKDIETPAPNRGVLSVSYALADYYGAQCVRWEVRGAEESAWREVATGTPKPMPEDTGSNPFFTMEYSVAPVSEGLHLAIETWGYGGIGLRYVEVRAPGLRLVPRAISAASGPVRDPERALSNDTYWCTLGEEDWYKVFLQPDLGNARSRVEIALGPA
jgi:hypothetical protein